MSLQLSPAECAEATLPSVLRRATMAAHHRIDHHPFLAPLVRADLQLPHYLKILDFFQRFYEELQPPLAESIRRFGCDYELGDRLAWLRTDLGYFAHGNPLPALNLKLPRLQKPAQLVGLLYVIEGSTRGGQVIARQLQSSLQLTAAHGACFFTGWGEGTIRHWQDFWRFADAHCPPQWHDAAIASAIELFLLLEDSAEIVHARP